MDMIWWIIILLFLFGGGGVKVIRSEIESRHRRKLELTGGPQPICGCRHHYSYHNPKTGECAEMSRQAVAWDDFGSAEEWELVKCNCQRYVGPEPLETLYMPEISSSYTKKDDA